MKKIYSLLTIVFVTISSQAQVVISQVYGGGGNTGATYSNDFIELYNRGTTPQNLNGWSVQYASATGTSWGSTPLPDFTLQPGQYFLIQEAVGANAATALPTPDLNGIGIATSPSDTKLLGLALSGSNGKVILVNSTTLETTVNPTGSQIIDKVGYGTTPTGFEGTGPTGTALTSTTSAQRNNLGSTDTDNNAADFTAALPIPRNSTYVLGVKQNSISGLSVYPNPVTNGNLFITSNSNEAKLVSIYDVLGKQVVKTTVTNQPLNVSNLNSGVYIVKITEEGKTATRKLVIR